MEIAPCWQCRSHPAVIWGYCQDCYNQARTEAPVVTPEPEKASKKKPAEPVPDPDAHRKALLAREAALIDAVPDTDSGWATFRTSADWHPQWLDKRREFVRTGNDADFEAMLAYVTSENPPLRADIAPSPAPAPARPARLTASLATITLLVAAFLATGWALFPSPAAIPAFLGVLAILVFCILRPVFSCRR